MFLCRAVYVLKPLRLAVKNCLPRILSLEFLNRLSADCTKREPLQYRGGWIPNLFRPKLSRARRLGHCRAL